MAGTPSPRPSPQPGEGEEAPLQGRESLLRRERALAERQAEPLPDINQRLGEDVDQRVLMIRRGRDAQALGAAWHRRIVDRLDVDAVVVEKEVTRRLALLG